MGGAHSHEVGSVSGEDGSYPQTQLQATPRLKLEHLNQLCRESVCGVWIYSESMATRIGMQISTVTKIKSWQFRHKC